ERTLVVPQLPAAWDGLTILHLSDLHLHGTPDRVFFQEVMDLCAAWEPDLVAITGDIVDSDHHHRWIVPTLGRLRWRIAAFGILGGQIRLPLVGSVIVPSRYGRRYDCGTFDEPPTLLHVSRGLSGKEPVRYNCRPEVAKLVLRS